MTEQSNGWDRGKSEVEPTKAEVTLTRFQQFRLEALIVFSDWVDSGVGCFSDITKTSVSLMWPLQSENDPANSLVAVY